MTYNASWVNLFFFTPLVCDTLLSLRIEVEACNLKEKIEKLKANNSDEKKSPKEATSVAIEVSLDFIYPGVHRYSYMPIYMHKHTHSCFVYII